jgi:glycosyltransferase involved in cell wall biosynthesis
MAKITVCIPTYNRAAYLREAIHSVLAQTFGDFELLVSDNASTDNTAEVVAGFGDPRVRYHRQPQNVGIGENHRSVTALAQGEFVAVLSDDDLYQPDHLDRASAALNDYPQAAYYTCALERFGNGASGIWRPAGIAEPVSPLIYFSPRQAVDFLGRENPGFMNTMVCRKDRLRETLFWGKLGYVHMDMLVMTQLMVQGGCLFGDHASVRYRCHATNISRQTADRARAERLVCMLWYGVRYLAQFLLDTETCAPADLEQHGLSASSPLHVANFVFGLGSFDSSPALWAVARRVFQARTDVDRISGRFRLARRVGFVVIPVLEKVSQLKSGWRP